MPFVQPTILARSEVICVRQWSSMHAHRHSQLVWENARGKEESERDRAIQKKQIHIDIETRIENGMNGYNSDMPAEWRPLVV